MAEDYDGGATKRGLFRRVTGAEEEVYGGAVTAGLGCGGCDMVRVREEKKLRLGFWLCEGERVMRCHSIISYFSEWGIEDVTCIHWLI